MRNWKNNTGKLWYTIKSYGKPYLGRSVCCNEVNLSFGDEILRLGNNLKMCRLELGNITQRDLAKKVDVKSLTILMIEKRKQIPSVLLGLKIAKVFGMSVEEIFYIIDDKKLLDGRR
ncbi:MAG: helix-turn-helix transcriptional regulator [Planctomycetota bacterium]